MAAPPGLVTNCMSAEPSREFVDANILVYAFDASAGGKQTAARQLIARLWDQRTGCLSVQVLQEFFVTVTRKVKQPLSPSAAADRIREFAAWNVFSPRTEDVLAAILIHQNAQISFWDALIVHAAAELNCDVLWTEDLNPGQVPRPGLRISSPFA